MNVLRASVFNFECLDILRDSIGHPSKKLLSFEFCESFCINFDRHKLLNKSIGHPSQKLLSFEFAQSFYFQFRVSRYITGLNRSSELKVIVFWICLELLFSISCISIYYRTHSNFPVKSYCRLNFVRASIFNFERLELLNDSIGHLSQKLHSFEFPQSFCFQFWASRYITGHNQTSE